MKLKKGDIAMATSDHFIHPELCWGRKGCGGCPEDKSLFGPCGLNHPSLKTGDLIMVIASNEITKELLVLTPFGLYTTGAAWDLRVIPS
tara:strand:+ start:587 stop:853 length:267 start_codon:yes stop_codon:yes gene_type:complete